MSTQSLDLTLVGWIGSDVRQYHEADGGTPFASFRLGSTRRWFDRRAGDWRDGRTEWFTVKVWRQAALNVARSLRKGDPVVVHGRLSTEEWSGPEGPRTTLVLEAKALGPDLTYGTAHFGRTLLPARHDGAGEGVVGDRDDDQARPVDVTGLATLPDGDLVPAEDVEDDEREEVPGLAAVGGTAP